MNRPKYHDWLKELSQLARDAEAEKQSPNRTQCGALVEAVELFVQHLKETAATASSRMRRGDIEFVVIVPDLKDITKRYAVVLVDDDEI